MECLQNKKYIKTETFHESLRAIYSDYQQKKEKKRKARE